MKRQVYLIYNREEKRYYAGTDGDDLPIWSDEVDLARIYTVPKDADDQYEILRQLGYDVEVR